MPGQLPVLVGGSRVSAAAWLAVALFAAWPEGVARADLQIDGRWRQGALREEFTVQQWLPNGCGPTPQTGSSGGGEIVAIRLEGDELAFVGGGRVYRSNQCYDQMPTLQRETHTRDANGKTWRTRCTTPPNDPRKAILNTLVIASSDTHIDIVETGRYEIVLETGRCVADVKRTRTYDIVAEEKPASVATSTGANDPKPLPEPKPKACDSPGDPVGLEVRPSKKLLRPGESFQFRASVLDAKGCVTRTPTTWRLVAHEHPGVTVDPNGKITLGKDVPEGSIEITVTAAGKDTLVAVEVTSPAHYDDLLASSGLNASGETDAASVATIASTIGAGESRVEDRAAQRRWIFMGVVGGVLLALGVLATLVGRRARRAAALERAATERHETEVAEVLERRRAREEQHAVQKRAHEESVAAAAAARAKAQASVTAQAPGTGTAQTTSGRASADSASAPFAQGAASPRRAKICPTCGDRFEGGADYCGKDGTHLVLLN